MSEDTNPTAKVRELLSGQRTAMLVTLDGDGTPVSRPMGVQDVEFDGDVWLFAERDSPKVAEIEANAAVNLAFTGLTTWVSLSGQATIVDDIEKKKELWDSMTEAWLPQGPEDDSVVLIRVEAISAEYWDTPGGLLSTAISFAKAKVTGKRFDGGETEVVDLT